MCKRHMDWLSLAYPPPLPAPRDLAYNPGTCPDWELNEQHFSSQASTQSMSHTSQGWYLFVF